ncbi:MULTISPECIES: TonB-dependent receptor [Pacificimonas]|nr:MULTISPECIES: TonB-dependent receptor [Pacificimonas]MBZ6377850.1 TonB-dependent receptor [Pacificimonas aurantium]
MAGSKALVRLLAGLPVRIVQVGERAWRIEADPGTLNRSPVARQMQIETASQIQLASAAPITITASKRGLTFANYAGPAVVLGESETEFFNAGTGTDAIVDRVATIASTHGGSGRNKLFIRGIADSSFLGPTQATVGQYLGDTRLNYNAPDPDLMLYDISRIEILEGPQGTLYGAGSLGGVIRVVPNAPDPGELALKANGGASLTQHGDPGGDLGAAFNLPIATGGAAVRVVGYGAIEGGYIDDTGRQLEDINRVETYGGRASLRWTPSANWVVDVSGAFQTLDARDSQFADRDAPPWTRESAVSQGYSSDFVLADLTITGNWGDISLVSSTGVVRQNRDEQYDASPPDGPSAVFLQSSESLLLTTENRISKDMNGGFGWVAGLSLLRNEVSTTRSSFAANLSSSLTGVENDVEEATLFAEGSVEPADGLVLTAGGRATYARLTGRGRNVASQFIVEAAEAAAAREETTFLPSVGLLYRATGDVSLFARYQEGFRPGGLAVRNQFVQRFKNDRVATVEAGLRVSAPHLSFSATLAHTDWDDIQADIILVGGFPTTANIGDGRLDSLDLRGEWQPLRGLSLSGGLFLNDSEVTEPAADLRLANDARLPNVADLGAQARVAYEAPLRDGVRLNAALAAHYVGSSQVGLPGMADQPQGDYAEAEIHIRLGTDNHGISLGVTNLFDTAANRFSVGTPFTLDHRAQVTPLRPRTVRLGFDASF